MVSEFSFLFSCVRIPQPDHAVPVSTDKCISISAEGNARNLICMLGEEVPELFGIDIPQADSLVPTPTGERFTIRTECNRPDNFRVPFKGCYELSVCDPYGQE